MKDSWFNHNTDKLLLFAALLLAAGMVLLVAWKFPDMQLITWATGTFTAILGAFLMIMTGRGARADGQTSNGTPPNKPPEA